MTVNHKLAGAAGALAILALLAGSVEPAPDLDLAALARDVEAERDHVDALELAKWLRAQTNNLRVIDIRALEDYEAYHIPTARNVPLTRITELNVKPTDVVVLYSDGGTHSAQAWFFLKAMGAQQVYFLRGGLNEWLDEVMNPRLPVDARTRELTEYFGGRPTADGPDRGATLEERVRRIKGRTC